MKTSSLVFLAFAVMTGAVTNAYAEGPSLNPPDIKGKLNTLVERKMETLIESKATVRGTSGEDKELTRDGARLPEGNQDTFIYVVSDSRK